MPFLNDVTWRLTVILKNTLTGTCLTKIVHPTCCPRLRSLVLLVSSTVPSSYPLRGLCPTWHYFLRGSSNDPAIQPINLETLIVYSNNNPWSDLIEPQAASAATATAPHNSDLFLSLLCAPSLKYVLFVSESAQYSLPKLGLLNLLASSMPAPVNILLFIEKKLNRCHMASSRRFSSNISHRNMTHISESRNSESSENVISEIVPSKKSKTSISSLSKISKKIPVPVISRTRIVEKKVVKLSSLTEESLVHKLSHLHHIFWRHLLPLGLLNCARPHYESYHCL
ncbi:unnamed protein product [Protopolystoma xenopodis]|uniref:Uncharacterized protein n=1 Tax=Protopolystoma xenopodis TaxID=117903 RepID=A0A448WU48_9PLAT|nr:unnamed protein product [Protopolystoma xenopodis]